MTNRCNQFCFHCSNEDGYNEGKDFDVELFLKRLDEYRQNETRLSEIREIRMTGGEPLLCLDAVERVARAASGYGIISGINTNLSLFDADTARRLKKAGLKVVKASLDALDEAIYSKMRSTEARLSDTLSGVELAVREGFYVMLRFTLCAYNRFELLDCYRYAQKAGIDKFQIKPLVNAGRATESDAFLDRTEIMASLEELSRIAGGDKAVPEILCWPPEESFGLACKVCGSIDKIYFTPAGEAIICNYLPTPAPGSIGNLNTDPLDIIIEKCIYELEEIAHGRMVLAGCQQTGYFNAEGGVVKARARRC